MAHARRDGEDLRRAIRAEDKHVARKNGDEGPLAGALGAVYLFGLLGADEEAAWISGWEPIVLGENSDQDIG